MKKLAILILLLLFVLVGCQDESELLSPTFESSPSDGSTWISLPEHNTLSKETQFSTTKRVNRNEDTELIIDESYKGGIHGEVKIIAKIKFYKGTVKKNTDVTMTVDSENGTLSFSPSMEFNKDVELYVKFEGLDLTDLKNNEIDFVYMANDGTIGLINYKEIIFDKSSGILELKECKVPHFSRYGWTRTTTTK